MSETQSLVVIAHDSAKLRDQRALAVPELVWAELPLARSYVAPCYRGLDMIQLKALVILLVSYRRSFTVTFVRVRKSIPTIAIWRAESSLAGIIFHPQTGKEW